VASGPPKLTPPRHSKFDNGDAGYVVVAFCGEEIAVPRKALASLIMMQADTR
jgi:hypothetical protein